MEMGLFQNQSMKLVMTAELRQAITLLQYPMLELAQFIEEQALENPLIELEDLQVNSQVQIEKYEMSNEAKPYEGDVTTNNPIDFVSRKNKSLHEMLLEQAQWLEISEGKRAVLKYLILNLDENGFLLSGGEEEIARKFRLNYEDIRETMGLLQGMEPAGVGARDFRECLLLQLHALHVEDPVVEAVIKNHLSLLAEKKWKQIARELAVSLAEVQSAAQFIQTLHPYPCAANSIETIQYLHPDIIIRKADSKYTIGINDEMLPSIGMNARYRYLMNGSDEVSHYVRQNYQKFTWLIKSIEQRRLTLVKVTEVIFDKQRDFLEYGLSALKPLTLKEVATEIGMHESTISRATKNKIVQTPKGAYEFKQFFSSRVGSEGQEASATKVKYLIKELIDSEEKNKPLSDQKIAEQLKKTQGITISRRTVAKYRNELQIGGARHR
jgi:RNA polymerase sigma-54 factor